MKSFEMKEVDGTSYKEVLSKIVTFHPERGVSIAEMRPLMKILEKLEKSNSVLELEDAEHSALLDRIDEFKFGRGHPDLIAMRDAIANAT